MSNFSLFFLYSNFSYLHFVLSRKIINIYNDIARKYGNVRAKDFRRYEKLQYKKNKLKLDIELCN